MKLIIYRDIDINVFLTQTRHLNAHNTSYSHTKKKEPQIIMQRLKKNPQAHSYEIGSLQSLRSI